MVTGACARPALASAGSSAGRFGAGKGTPGRGRAGEHAIQKLGDTGFGFRVEEHAVGELGDKGLPAQKKCAEKIIKFGQKHAPQGQCAPDQNPKA
jgi:hypothetical protein